MNGNRTILAGNLTTLPRHLRWRGASVWMLMLWLALAIAPEALAQTGSQPNAPASVPTVASPSAKNDANTSASSTRQQTWCALVSSLSTTEITFAPDLTGKTCPGQALTEVVKFQVGPSVETKLKDLRENDAVLFTSSDANQLLNLQPRKLDQEPGMATRLFALGLGFLVVFVLALLFTGGHPVRLILGRDNRYSNSQFQMAVWFCVGISGYLATVGLRWTYGLSGIVNIPQNLLMISGLSALTYAGAKAVTSVKDTQAHMDTVDPNPAVRNAAHQMLAAKAPAKSPNFPQDLATNDAGVADIGDFQMVVVTLIAVATYLVLLLSFLGVLTQSQIATLPDVDTTILASFGIGQGAYLTKKLASKLGDG